MKSLIRLNSLEFFQHSLKRYVDGELSVILTNVTSVISTVGAEDLTGDEACLLQGQVEAGGGPVAKATFPCSFMISPSQ